MIKPGEEPFKYVKARAATINRKREIEAFSAEKESRSVSNEDLDENDPSKSALYGEWQTEPFSPVTIQEDGRIPTNSFGNIELFHPRMLPIGAVHLKRRSLLTSW